MQNLPEYFEVSLCNLKYPSLGTHVYHIPTHTNIQSEDETNSKQNNIFKKTLYICTNS